MSSFGGSVPFAYRSHPATKPDGWYFQSATPTTYSSALATIADTTTAPSTSMTTGRWLITQQKPVIQLAFTVSDADNETAAFGVYGVRSFTISGTKYYSFCTMLTGSVTAGAKVVTGSGNDRWADTITVSTVSIPSTSYRSVATADDMAFLEIDTRDFENILVVCTLSGSTGAGVSLAEGYASL